MGELVQTEGSCSVIRGPRFRRGLGTLLPARFLLGAFRSNDTLCEGAAVSLGKGARGGAGECCLGVMLANGHSEAEGQAVAQAFGQFLSVKKWKAAGREAAGLRQGAVSFAPAPEWGFWRRRRRRRCAYHS